MYKNGQMAQIQGTGVHNERFRTDSSFSQQREREREREKNEKFEENFLSRNNFF